jgi:tRNA modification GTPase
MSGTIVALASAAARSAIAVVRLSGPKALDIAEKVFVAAGKTKISLLKGFSACYGEFISGGEAFDDGVALVYRAPKSYTGEDMVEFFCHGNILLVNRLIDACIIAGAVPAMEGEFTRRAFENEKMDLSAAEAVAELIEADGLLAAKAALARRKGALNDRVEALSDGIVDLSAQLAVWSDFPEEEDSPDIDPAQLEMKILECSLNTKQMLDSFRMGRLVQNGAQVAIIGSPNVGKSALMNLMAGRERSIVTDIPGTTRDVVEETIEIEGIKLKLLDTAGIRETDDRLELLGIERSRAAMKEADGVILVLDASRPLGVQDRKLIDMIRQMPHVVALNKTDLPMAVFPQELGEYVEISAATGEGGRQLRQALLRVLSFEATEGALMISNKRQHECLLRTDMALDESLEALRSGITLDAVAVLLEEAIVPLAELTGERVHEAVIDKVFSSFCVGK